LSKLAYLLVVFIFGYIVGCTISTICIHENIKLLGNKVCKHVCEAENLDVEVIINE